jgi:hypothetical protein
MNCVSFPWSSVVAARFCKRLALTVHSSENSGSMKLSLHQEFNYVHQILPFASNCAEDNLRLKSRLPQHSVTIKVIRLNVPELIHHCLIFMTSSMWYFSYPRHLAASLLQLVKRTDKDVK